ncbi:MAG: LysM peptidoglycan-binding domain-containing protein [Methylacidiphilales bacterium]|nr:LysM peptidoglycan-binding domain-containing protein [Candidatus Methylacidiphilales bacterium]
MMNGLTYFRTFFAVVLALSASSIFVAKAQTAPPLPATNNPAPAATPAPAPAPAEASGAPAEQPTTYTVVSGDSLWKIAHQFHTSIRKLKKLNNLKNNNLKPGQVLQIPPATSSTQDQPKTTNHHKVKTIQQTEPEVAAVPDTTPEPAIEQPADADALAPLIPVAQPVTATAQTKPLHHHKKKPLQPQEPEVAGARRAQPVQDFDVPASTFASCPVPVPVETDTPETSPVPVAKPAPPAASEPVAEEETPAPRAALVSPSELATAPAPPAPAPPAPAETVTNPPAPESAPAPSDFASSQSSKHGGDSFVTDSTSNNGESTSSSLSANDWADRFKIEAENLANRDIDYNEEWRPPGESQAWVMDCSNTSRYLYKVTTGIQLPRTASDQYYYLHQQNKAWDVPQAADGFADCNYLRENLKPGDLLFWENTYRPDRQPPITHVMIFLGTNEKGQWIMAGSQTSRGGLHNRRHGGPDIYVFDPTKPCGGYSTWFGIVHHQGRFCAYGRPLEADPAKLSVAANN